MNIRAIIHNDNEVFGDMGTVYLQTSNAQFIEEVQKYVCPIRLLKLLEEQRGLAYEELVKEPKSIDLTIDLTSQTENIMQRYSIDISTSFDKYIEATSNLDKYGVEN